MTATEGKTLSAGLQRVVIFELDANGYPDATGSTAYEGFELIGPKAFTLTIPEQNKVTHYGRDRVLGTQYFPAREGVTARLTVDGDEIDVQAALSGVLDYDIADAHMMSGATDQQGNEPDVGVLLVQAALDASTRLGHRKFYIVPASKAIYTPASMDENAAEVAYALTVNPSTKHLWGTALDALTEGASEAGYDQGDTRYRPNIVAFKGNGSTTVFLLPTDKPAVGTSSMKAWKDGVLQSPTLATTQITLSPAPASGTKIVLFYEY